MTENGRLTCELPNISFLAVSGTDAGDFLQRQTTQNVAKLMARTTALAGWLDARGRVRAVFRVLRSSGRWILAIVDQDAAAIATDLRVYVLRNDVELAIEPGWTAVARIGAADDWLAARTERCEDGDEIFVVEVAPGLHHLYGPSSDIRAIAGPLDDAAQVAIAAEIEAGIPSVAAALSQQFTAHMLNLDALGAVDFAKGCYPGQEVTARTQNLGTVKRRAFPFRCDCMNPPPLDTAIVDHGGHTVGRVIRAAGRPGDLRVLAVVELDRATAPLHLDTADHPRLDPFDPPT